MRIFILIAFLQPFLFGMDITSCDLSGKKDSGNFVYSAAIMVKGISFKEGKVLMPVEQNKDKAYENIKLVSRQSYEKLVYSFSKGGCDSYTKISNIPFKIKFVRKLKSPYRIANVEIEFSETLLVVFGLMKNKNGELWVSIPKDLEFLDKNLEKKVKEEVIKSIGQVK